MRFVNNILNSLQLSSSLPLVTWLLQILALTSVISPAGWPATYKVRDGEWFDFVVIGSGSGGGVVAARLSEIPYVRVLLIEAGGDPPVASVVPSLFSLLAHTEYDWDYKAYLDEGTGRTHPNGTVYMTRGKMLGGTSSINYQIYARGVPRDYEEWNQISPGWDWSTVLYYFKKMENMTDPSVLINPYNSYLHSTKGPVSISRSERNNYFTTVDSIVLNSYHEMGIKMVLENNGPEILGAARPHFTFANGRRSSTAEAYLRPAKDRTNLYIAKNARVTKVLIDLDTLSAYGVEVMLKSGKIINVLAYREVILSAGTIDTPKILMLSGIGPRQELMTFNLPVIADLPVGKNLHDHQLIPIVFIGKRGLKSAIQNVLVLKELDSFPVPIQCGFFKLNEHSTNYMMEDKPQFQVFNVRIGALVSPLITHMCRSILNYEDSFCSSMGKANLYNEIDITLLVLLHPRSRGEITLRSSNPLDDPIIRMGYYRNRRDVSVTAEGIQFMTNYVNTSYYRKVNGRIARLDVTECKEIEWGTGEYWHCYARHVVGTLLHPVGTCSMGPNGVVDERLRVYGVSGLRIVDASVMPTIPSGNTNAPTMMIGERAADLIKQDYNLL